MVEERTERRLAAILAADVVGYSRLMRQDEAGTLAALKARRSQVLQPLVSKHRGRIIKLMGDGVLVEFASAVNAVLCAVELQNAMAAANADLPHYALAIGSVFRGSFEESIRAAERSVEISPSFALGHLILGLARLFSGHAREAIPPLQRGLRLSPYDPQNFYWFGALGLALFFNDQPQQALESALRALEIRPTWRQSLETAIICYVALDRMAEARALVDQIRRNSERQGDLSRWLRKHNPRWARRMSELLEQAEVPP